jgi:hypothetical protein
MNRRDLLKAGAAAAAAAPFLAGEARGAPPPKPDVPAPRLLVRPSEERGKADHGWLRARYSFSFSRYHDPRHMGFRGLRVINEDRIAPAGGFPMHPHQDMEIITYVLGGSLEHRDSMGNGSVIVPGELQRMSAGTGIYHSEFNPSKEVGTHLLQIWILPRKRRIEPSWSQKDFPLAERTGLLRLLASPTGAHDSLAINADAHLYAGVLQPRKPVLWTTPKSRHTWIQVARGEMTVNDRKLSAGDGARTSDAGRLRLETPTSAEVLLFDLA